MGGLTIDGEGFLDQETRVLLRLKSSSHLYFFFQNAKKGKCKFKSKKNVDVIGVSLQTAANPPFFFFLKIIPYFVVVLLLLLLLLSLT